MNRPTTAWRPQVAIAVLAQNVATGLTFGSFGTLVLAIERDYGANRSQSSLALSLAVLSLSLTGMLVGRGIDRADLRRLMIFGALLCAAGFACASFAASPAALLAAYALLIGPGTAMAGVLPSMTLATRWAPEATRGRALGLVNMPILVMVTPLIVEQILKAHDTHAVYLVLAAVALALIPVLLLVRNGKTDPSTGMAPPAAARTILRRVDFWVVTVAVGILTGAGTLKLAHFIPLLTSQGRTFEEANLLLALSGGSGLIGSLLFGYLSDRIGGLKALAINATLQSLVWTIFLAPVTMPVLTLDAIVVGACGGGVQGAFGVAVARLFGPRAFGRAFSLFQFSTLPFLFGMTPLASIMFERSGAYYLPMAATIGCLAVSALLFLALSKRGTRPSTSGET